MIVEAGVYNLYDTLRIAYNTAETIWEILLYLLYLLFVLLYHVPFRGLGEGEK